MLTWEKHLCPDCSFVWERNLDGAWRYISMIAMPLPEERACPICKSSLQMKWLRPLPVLPENDKQA